jgi:dephospho-CoA kinase
MIERKPVVVVSGRIATGKTTFARALAFRIEVGCVGFGDEVRAMAEARELPNTRDVLQRIGEEQVRDHPREFCEAVLKRGGYVPGGGIVLEGLRHVQVLVLLRRLLAPDIVIHVHISSPDELRAQRMSGRGRAGDANSIADTHSTEVQLFRELPEAADVTIDGSCDVAEMVRNAVAQIRPVKPQTSR